MTTPTPNTSPADAVSPVGATGEAHAQQQTRYWLTPAGCAVTSGHRPDLDDRHCRTCGVLLGGA